MPDILIADDHPLFRDALERAVRIALPEAALHSAVDVHRLLELIEKFPDADLLLLDLHMPGAPGYTALAHIRGQYPGLPVIVISAHEEVSVARRTLAYGAAAYVPKSTSAADIVAAIHSVLAGDVWLPETWLGSNVQLKPGEVDAAERIATLTPQQFRVLAMLAEGKLNKQMAWEMGVSEATIKAHMTAVMRKLGVNNRTQAALIASELALESEPLGAPPEQASG
jgi:DNA-binding NarL/FixJ family response regulator